MHLVPELGTAYDSEYDHPDFAETVKAADRTADLLRKHGAEWDDEDEVPIENAEKIFLESVSTLKAPSSTAVATLPVPVIQRIKELIDQYSDPVVQHAEQIRNLLLNKLLLDTDNADPRVRLKAIEMLGEVPEIGIFAGKLSTRDVTYSNSDLKIKLREKLMKFSRPATLLDQDDIVSDVDLDD